MYVYKVSPIVSYLPFLELSYFSASVFEIGDVVDISFGNRKLKAIILNTEDIVKAKVDIRNANFKTQKIISKIAIYKIESKILEKIIIFANENFIAAGEIVHYLSGEDGIDFKFLINKDNLQATSKYNVNELRQFDKFKMYEEYIYESIKNKENLTIIFSDDMSMEAFKQRVKSLNIKKYKYIHIVKPKEAIKILLEYKKNNIILKNLFIDEAKFEENILVSKPYINQFGILLLLLEFINTNIENIYLFAFKFFQKEVDYFHKLNLEITQSEYVNNNFETENIRKFFVNKIIEDSENYIKKNIEKEKIVSDNIIEIIKQKLQERTMGKKVEKQKIFLFVLSHGYSKALYCGDCNSSYKCKSCDSNMSLEVEEYKNYLYCKNCKAKEALRNEQLLLCKGCGGFNFNLYGVGIERVYQYIKEKIDSEILYFDEKEKKINNNKIITNIQNLENGIIIGSLRSLYAFTDIIDASIIIHLGTINTDKNETVKMNLNNLNKIESRSKEMYIQRVLSDIEEKNIEKDKYNFWYNYKNNLPIKDNDVYKIITVTTNFTNKKYLIKLGEIFTKSGEYVKNKQLVNIFVIDNKNKILSDEKLKLEIDAKIRDFISFARNFSSIYIGDEVKEFTFIQVKR